VIQNYKLKNTLLMGVLIANFCGEFSTFFLLEKWIWTHTNFFCKKNPNPPDF
jgi:hypothetical protein